MGTLGTVGVLSLVGYLWAPQLPFGGPGPFYGPTRASFAPIPADTRGTLFDTVGVPQPAWATFGAQLAIDVPSIVPASSPAVPAVSVTAEPTAAPARTPLQTPTRVLTP